MAVIKAGAYGSGSITLAKQLLRSGVDYLAVAYYDEAIELRKEGINSSIMIMNPDPSLTFLAEKYSLELEIYSLEQLKRIIQVQSSPIKIHIKIDSGMHRLGIEKRDVDNLLEILRNNHECKVVSIFSHFSCSENPDEDDFTRDQYQYFLDCYAMIMRALNDSTIIKHICNSSAAIRFPEYHHGMIRLGIGMYGYSGMEGAKMAHTLKTYVAQIKDIFPGDSVGYSRAYIAEEKIKIATLCIGYADGISRNLGNGNISFRINGNEVKTIGNISMDTCAVDISGFDVRVGDEVVIFDSLSKFMEIAVKSGKTSYELISGIGNRVVKSYVKEV